jgi:iron-sulfur cluster repair protein YtfE (RIC family)
MTPSQTRDKLLQQHARLRELMSAAAKLAARLLAAGAVDAAATDEALLEFRGAVQDLRAAVAEHNETEEAILAPVLRAADAWGPLRVDRMIEEHAAEHAAFRAALAGDELDVAERMGDLAEELDAHMAAEERTFLSAAVLRDDVLNLDTCS